MSLENLPEVVERWESWWNRTNTEPVFYIIYPTEDVDFSPVAKEWMSPYITGKWSNWQQELVVGQALEHTWRTGDWSYVDQALDLLEFYAKRTGHAAEGYPFLLPGFGPGVLSAFISGYTEFHENTIWFELKEPWDWDRIAQITPDTRSAYVDLALEALRRLVARMQPHAVIAMPDVGAVLDVLSAVRGASNLLMDTLIAPDQVSAAVSVIESMLFDWLKRFDEIIQPGNHGCSCETMRYLSAKPTHIGICDFSAMIGPETFEQYGLPTLVRECAAYPHRLVYHMDGPGQMPHLPALLGIEKLHAIQWVPGAGNPGGLDEHWFDLYRKILDGGKRICLSGAGPDPERVRALFKAFPRQEFVVPFTLGSESSARQVVELKKA